MKSNKQYDIQELLIRFLENDLTDAQRKQLLEWSRSDPKAARQYCEFIKDYALVDTIVSAQIEPEFGTSDDSAFDRALWSALLEDQKTSPEIEIPQEKPKRELIQKVIYPPQEKRRISKFNLIFLAANIAAVLFLLPFVRINTFNSGVEVATLSDSINATWSGSYTTIHNNTRLVTGKDKLVLKEGLAELLFDNNAKAVIEGPAEFQILADDRIGLIYGKICATVPPEAVGFSIYTGNSKIIDMGTEFGVQADFNGNTELSVLNGKIMLLAGDSESSTKSEVLAGFAKKVSGITGEISDIKCQSHYYVRDIDSESNMVWRGKNLSLTCIVAGLEEFPKVISLVGLDPLSGKHVASVSEAFHKTNNAYNPVDSSKFIDGVFVPDGGMGPIQVTSEEDTYDCPDTSGNITHAIAVYKGPTQNLSTTIPQLMVNGREVVNEPILVLHSNSGMTFDLQAVRKSFPRAELKSLKATGACLKRLSPDLNFCVLVDGQIKYERNINTIDRNRDAVSFRVDFSPADRFLTLIVTDGSSGDFANDFFYLINPELCVTDSIEK